MPSKQSFLVLSMICEIWTLSVNRWRNMVMNSRYCLWDTVMEIELDRYVPLKTILSCTKRSWTIGSLQHNLAGTKLSSQVCSFENNFVCVQRDCAALGDLNTLLSGTKLSWQIIIPLKTILSCTRRTISCHSRKDRNWVDCYSFRKWLRVWYQICHVTAI